MLPALIVPIVGKIIDVVVQQSKSKTVLTNASLLAALPTALAYLEPVLTKKEFAITAAVMVIASAIINMLLRQKTKMPIAEKTKLLE